MEGKVGCQGREDGGWSNYAYPLDRKLHWCSLILQLINQCLEDVKTCDWSHILLHFSGLDVTKWFGSR